MMLKTKTKECNCPKCGVVLDAASSSDDRVPKKGDLSICITCGVALTFFSNDLGVRALSDEELGNLPEEALRELEKVRASLGVAKLIPNYGGESSNAS